MRKHGKELPIDELIAAEIASWHLVVGVLMLRGEDVEGLDREVAPSSHGDFCRRIEGRREGVEDLM